MMRRPTYLRPLPATYAETRTALHALAEQVLCVARHGSAGRVGMVAALDGVATPPFGPTERTVAIEADELVDRDRHGERRAPISTVRAAAEFLGVSPGVPGSLWSPQTAVDLDAPLAVDSEAVAALADWYGFVSAALDGLRQAGAPLDQLTLWPEGFDLATTGGAVNYGGSPGDRYLDGPYLYVGPFERSFPAADPPYWNAAFGAALPYDRIGSFDEAVAFLVRGYHLTST